MMLGAGHKSHESTQYVHPLLLDQELQRLAQTRWLSSLGILAYSQLQGGFCMQSERTESGQNQCKGTHLMVFVFVGHMIPFLSVFLFPEEVAAEAETVVDDTEDKREAGGTEDTPNILALMEAGLVIFNRVSAARTQGGLIGMII